jgi:NAD(P)-dependent dehydrogenase (short-subunit alcohol dehydrogenase family)
MTTSNNIKLFSLENKNVLVTGASSGIGRAVCVQCSKSGANITAIGRNEERLKETVSLTENANNVSYFVLDLNEKQLAENFTKECKLYDGIVLAAGIDFIKPVRMQSAEDVLNIFQTNVLSHYHFINRLIKNKKLNAGASVIFITSVEGIHINTIGHSAYGISKSAMKSFSKSLALELSPSKIRVNCVSPAMVETPMIQSWITNFSKEDLEKDRLKYPLKRYGTPDDVAYACVFLLSDESSWITGSEIVLDGGLTIN